MSRLHFRAESTGPLSTALCGILGSDVTDDHAAVTCRLCMAALATQLDAGTVAPRDATEALVDAAAAGALPDADEAATGARAPFVLDRDRWRRVRDRCMCGSCDVCARMRAIRVEQHINPYEKRLRARTEEAPKRWSSPSAALETYVAHKMDGYPIKAWGGTLEAMRTLGRFVQEAAGSYSSAAERSAQDVVHVELALREAFQGTQHEALGTEACVAILLACGTGRLERVAGVGRTVQRYVPVDPEAVAAVYGLRVGEVESVVRVGRKRVGALLAARGLVREGRAA